MFFFYMLADLIKVRTFHMDKPTAFNAFQVIMTVAIVVHIGILINELRAVGRFKTAKHTASDTSLTEK